MMERHTSFGWKIIVALGFILFIVGCSEQSEGPATQTGKAIDEAIETSGDTLNEAMENTGEALKDMTESASETVGEAVDNTGEAIGDMAEKAGEATNEALGLND